jgi:Tol biopolymer transport system component
MMVPFEGSHEPVRLLQDAPWPVAGLSPDGDRLAYLGPGSQVMIRNLRNGSISSVPTPEEVTILQGFDWSGDGKYLLCIAMASDENQESVYTISVEDGAWTLLTPWRGHKGGPTWSPDDGWIAFYSDHAKFEGEIPPRYALYLLKSECAQAPATCKDEMVSFGALVKGDVGPVAWSPTGDRIAFVEWVDGRYAIYLISPDGSDLVDIFSSGSIPVIRLAWSPDGRQLAFTLATPSFDVNIEDTLDIFVIGADGTGLRNITNVPADLKYAAFWLEVP